MRLIDADALKLYIDKEVEEDKVLDGWAFFFKAYLDDAPTIDVDRLQGKWIRISSLYSLDRTYKCSVCDKIIDDMPMDEYYDPAYKGCPYCLTRMKRADDE